MNTAEIYKFPGKELEKQGGRVADIDDGYTRTANELLEAVMLSGLTQHQLLIVMAVWRKTYGYNKKMDWIGNEQFAELTGMAATKCSTAKNELIRLGVLVQQGRQIGMNKTISEWKTKFNGLGKSFTKTVKKTFTNSVKCNLPIRSNTKDNITKDNNKTFTSENSRESSDLKSKKSPVSYPGAAIQSGKKWGSAEDLRAAEWMFDVIKSIEPSARKPNFAGWANDIRLMREKDGRDHRDMCSLFRWASQDVFWSGNVLCPAKLRDKWSQLSIQRGKNKSGSVGKQALDFNNTDWAEGLQL